MVGGEDVDVWERSWGLREREREKVESVLRMSVSSFVPILLAARGEER